MAAQSTRSESGLSMEKSFILDQCAQIESKCAEVYRHFAAIHADAAELAALWQKTADEEEDHAQAFRMLGRMKGEGVGGVHADSTGVAAALRKLESLIELLKMSTVPPMEALKLALRMEAYLSQFHVNVVAVCDDAEMQKLLNAMMNNDLEHTEALEKTLEKFSVRSEGHPELHGKLQALIGEMKSAHLPLADTLKLELEFQAYLNEYYATLPTAGDAVGIRELLEASLRNHRNLARLLETRLTILEQ